MHILKIISIVFLALSIIGIFVSMLFGYTYEEGKVPCYDKAGSKIIGLECEGIHESINQPYLNILLTSIGIFILSCIGLAISNEYD